MRVGLAEHPDHISIEFERDASLRACEVLIINSNVRNGEEGEGVMLRCHDNGKITVAAGPRSPILNENMAG